MPTSLPKSLLLRLGLALSVIMGLAFMGMLSSVFIAEMGKGDASAINQAGSLRMQSYRIAAELLHRQVHDPGNLAPVRRAADEFEERLNSPRLLHALPEATDDPLRALYNQIRQRWGQDIRPHIDRALAEGLDSSDEELRRAHVEYLTKVDAFVVEVDHLVRMLEEYAESKIESLRAIQVITLFLTLAVVLITMHLMHTDVLIPLRELLICAERARHGDFSARVSHDSEDELGKLGRAFNVMSEDLSQKYADLEARVREKTADLERSNRSLELLYNTSQVLNTRPLGETTYTLLLDDIRRLVGTGPGTICLAGQGSNEALKLASTRNPPAEGPDLCRPPNCARCLGDGITRRLSIQRDDGSIEVMAVPILDQQRLHGVLLVELPADGLLDDWQVRLLETVAQNIAARISLAERDVESRRLALLEERGVIARELHDSLAQSLSYLKIQVARLAAALEKPDATGQAQPVIAELRDGLNSAYRQLRELLTTFRIKMEGRGLSSALEETVQEFRRRSGLDLSLVNRLHSTHLNANEEIHVLQVVREAISNIVKHARARRARVVLETREARVHVLVEDDGVGIPDAPHRSQHYGLAIMQERAKILGGELSIRRHGREHGTRVELEFTPLMHSGSELELT